ncbi:hypothetical protein [Actinomadura sp. NEAU-AAG7]|uniref:hypothetical protein n=1 Tax=Actinomadura sp. NEAU-AAG7 TaxID=2839640 RepID=UPI001BE44A5C|nr:hypothetical protein [Actinomadura sp. NEAU-AAG7]MBT2210774.1 hypothetical protein [Actinomadura sp. NEAU-AAG7]
MTQIIEDVTISGDGAQNAIGNWASRDLILTQLQFVTRQPSMVLSEGEIADRVAGYVPVPNHEEVLRTLHEYHAVGIAGAPGSGAATTAVAALRQLRPDLPIRQFSMDTEDVEQIGARQPQGYLVRAGDEEGDSRLRTCMEAVQASGGYLLVVGAAVQEKFREFLPVYPVYPPPPEAVYRAWLTRRGIDHPRWWNWSRAPALLRDAKPYDARRLAELAASIGNEHEVEQVYLRWNEQLHTWFAKNGEPRDQALMIAAATIAPADETSVYGAALSLARQLNIRPEGGGLVWCPSTGLNELLGADREGDRLVFRRQGYAESVLRHVWDDYPLTRTDLLTWLSALPVDDEVDLPRDLRGKLVEVFADLAAEHDAVDKILRKAEVWATRHGAADLSYIALARTCLHPRVGGRVRRRMYELATERRTPQMLKLTVAQVCEVLGQTHVSVALTRLKHLGTYGDDVVQEEVFQVVRALAAVHPEQVFQTLLIWCRTAMNLQSQKDMFNRARIGLRALLGEHDRPLPSQYEAPVPDRTRLRSVLEVMEQLAACGEHVRPLVVDAARTLAAGGYRAHVLQAALVWAGRPGPASMMGTEIFLMLAAEQAPDGIPVILTDPGAIDPVDCTPAWAVAIATQAMGQGGFAAFEGTLRLWLDAASRLPALRPRIVSMIERATGGDIMRRAVVLGIVRRWALTGPGRNGVKNDVLVRLLYPEWKRLLFVVWVWVSSMFVRDTSE